MIISFLQRPAEVAQQRKTILLDGKQCGWLQLDTSRVYFTAHFDPPTAAQILAEVERLEWIAILGHCMPDPTPPEWLPKEEEPASPIIIP